MIVGIDVGGTNTDIVSLEGSNFKHLASFKTAELCAERLMSFKDAKAIGVGIAAWIKNGKIIKAPNLSLKTCDEVLEFFRPKCIIENDANCFAIYASKILNVKNLFGVTVGTGIGSGIIIDGRLYTGSGIAGEIGHTFVETKRVCSCGETGHLEASFGGRYMDARSLLESGRIYKIRGFKLFCKSLAFAVMLLDPEVVALGGRIGGRLNAKIVKENVCKYTAKEFDFEIVTIKDDLAVAKGAALLASSQIPP